MNKIFAVLVILVLLAVVVAAPVSAGTRTYVNAEFGDGETIMNRYIDSLTCLRVRGYCLEEGISLILVIPGVAGSWEIAMSEEPTTYEIFVDIDPETKGVWEWNLTLDGSAYIEWYEVSDLYGDPAYTCRIAEEQNELLTQIVSNTTPSSYYIHPASYVFTDTLPAGTDMAVSQSFTWGELAVAISMAGAALIGLLGLAFRSAQ